MAEFADYIFPLKFWHMTTRRYQDANAVVSAKSFKQFDEGTPLAEQAAARVMSFLYDIYLENPQLLPDYAVLRSAADFLEAFAMDGIVDARLLEQERRVTDVEVEKAEGLIAKAKSYFAIKENEDWEGTPLILLAHRHALNILTVIAAANSEDSAMNATPVDRMLLRSIIFDARPNPGASGGNPSPHV
jgi:hypothetical protein